MDAAAAAIRALLIRAHHIVPPKRADFQIQNQKSLLETQQAAAAAWHVFLRWIAASALLVSGLGMLGITWNAVKERTTEIGTRRALGATAGDVFFQVLFESAVPAVLGCGLGLAVSWPLSRVISPARGSPLVFDLQGAALSVAASGLLNVLFALWPAYRAAVVSPLAALRLE